MYNHVLIPVALDHQREVSEKLRVARHLLSEGGRITLLSVVEQVPGYVAEYVVVKPERKILDDVQARLEEVAGGEPGVACAVVSGKPGVVIAEFAARNATDLILVGARRPGVQDYFLGSTASRVVRRAPCAVFVLR